MTGLQPLKHVAEVRFSNVDKKSVDGQVAVRLCNYTDVYYNERILADFDFMEATATASQMVDFTLRAGDVLITKDSETADDIGVTSLVPEAIAGVLCGYHLAIARPRPDLADGGYLRWALASAPARQQLAVGASGVTRFGLRQDTLGAVLLPVPDLGTQVRVREYLDSATRSIDRIIDARRAQESQLHERMGAYRDAWVDDLNRRYGTIRLKRMAVSIEQGWSPECDSIAAEPDEWGVLKTSAVSSGKFTPTENKRLAHMKPDPRWVIHDGDLLVVRGSGSPAAVAQAAVAITDGRSLVLADLLYRVRLDQADPYFLAHTIRSRYARGQFESAIRTDVGMTRKIRTEDLANLLVPAVPVGLQKSEAAEISAALDQIDVAFRRVRQQIALLQERRQALITAAVTGQLEIPGVAA